MNIFTDEFLAAIKQIVVDAKKPISKVEVAKKLGDVEINEAVGLAVRMGLIDGVHAKRGVNGGIQVKTEN